MGLYDKPSGRRIAVVAGRSTHVSRDEGAWVEVSDSAGGVGYHGWVPARHLARDQSTKGAGFGSGSGDSLKVGSPYRRPKDKSWQLAYRRLPLRESPGGPVLVDLSAAAQLQVVERNPQGAWVSVLGLRGAADEKQRRFWLEL
jgi:hypothetical protein